VSDLLIPKGLAKRVLLRPVRSGRAKKWHEVAVFRVYFEHPYTSERGGSIAVREILFVVEYLDLEQAWSDNERGDDGPGVVLILWSLQQENGCRSERKSVIA
jgi:hypothetical protein